ncbi:hypothetical protein HZA87_05830 [Candidatus Uhrbacteria bacterium]|nr:hypothetical protein [Candidatus Uhrbacteria bacterium]
MKRLIPHPLPDTPERLMAKAGYVRHCVETGRACYHRRLNEPPFPRFHAYTALTDRGMEVDLHFDALDSIGHQGNHDKAWAYEGGRIDEEMRRILEAICGRLCLKEIYHPSGAPSMPNVESPAKKRSLFDLIFKSM